jgi:DNA-directed RNA polymerases I, II, and III subunit RPABC2
MDSESQIGGAKPKLKLKSTSKSNKTSPNKKKKVKLVAEELGTSAGKTIIKVKENKGTEIKGKGKVSSEKEKEDKSLVDKTSIKAKKEKKRKLKTKSEKKSSKSINKKTINRDIVDLSNSKSDSIEYDYQNIIMNYNINNNKSINVLTQYEISVILGKRASQIAMGALPLIKVTSNMNHIDIAEEELRQKKTPFIIKREIGERAEYWKIEDLELSDVI